MPNDLAYYLSLNYPIELVRERDLFVASHPDLPGCMTQADSANEAVTNLDQARQAWIEVRFERSLFIPEPLPEDYSGHLTVRLPVSLHASLATAAQRQKVSLNSYIVTRLAAADGDRGAAVAETMLGEFRSLAAKLLASAEISLRTVRAPRREPVAPDCREPVVAARRANQQKP